MMTKGQAMNATEEWTYKLSDTLYGVVYMYNICYNLRVFNFLQGCLIASSSGATAHEFRASYRTRKSYSSWSE